VTPAELETVVNDARTWLASDDCADHREAADAFARALLALAAERERMAKVVEAADEWDWLGLREDARRVDQLDLAAACSQMREAMDAYRAALDEAVRRVVAKAALAEGGEK
jgi:hypothetical protein